MRKDANYLFAVIIPHFLLKVNNKQNINDGLILNSKRKQLRRTAAKMVLTEHCAHNKMLAKMHNNLLFQ